MMQGIDVSSHQEGIDLAAVPCDFAIVKATQGRRYVNPDYARATEQCASLGKPLGVYHYIDGSGAEAEADHFIDVAASRIGAALLVLDWEEMQNSAWGDESYLDAMVRRVVERTGCAPMVYSFQASFPWGVCERHGCPAWVAQYASMKPTGYQEHPWNEGAYECAIRQYSSAGRLDGYGGDLDLNKSYMDASEWTRMAEGGAYMPTPAAPAEGLEVDGLWGRDTTRAAQKALGTPVDGEVSGQGSAYRDANPGLLPSSWDWNGAGGSEMVRALQRKLSVACDGYVGPQTVSALQSYLGTPVDGCVSKPSAMVRALQNRLNAGRF